MELIKAMVGRQIDDLYGKAAQRDEMISDEIILDVQHISDTRNFVTDCSFQVHKGEILGIAGLVGREEVNLCAVCLELIRVLKER